MHDGPRDNESGGYVTEMKHWQEAIWSNCESIVITKATVPRTSTPVVLLQASLFFEVAAWAEKSFESAESLYGLLQVYQITFELSTPVSHSAGAGC